MPPDDELWHGLPPFFQAGHPAPTFVQYKPPLPLAIDPRLAQNSLRGCGCACPAFRVCLFFSPFAFQQEAEHALKQADSPALMVNGCQFPQI